jgi:hypothetical protein
VTAAALTLEEIRERVNALAERIGAPAQHLPTYGRSDDLARPHVEVDERGYHYVVVERGQELERRTFSELDDLLYRIFRGVVAAMATDYELDHRASGQDFRRVLFVKRFELLAQLSPEWEERERTEIARVLETNPFDDRA